MTISWYGLSCFEITSKTAGGEVTLVIDPYDNTTGLRFPRTLSANVVAISHNEMDANNHSAVQGEPFVIDMPGEYEVQGIFVYALQAPLSHKDGSASRPSGPPPAAGKEKGGRDHRIFRIEQEGMRLAHLGALDRILTDDELQQLNNIDILMIPVGGGRVLSAKQAVEVIGQLEPRVVIPMTHAVQGVKETLGSVNAFCKELGVCQREEATKYKVSRKDLPEENMVIMVLQRV